MIFQDLHGAIRFCKWNSMKYPSQMTRSKATDDAREHTGRGSPACTTTASDEAKASTEAKAEVEMMYMLK